MKITDAYDLASELSRCRAVATRHAGHAQTDPNPTHARLWRESAQRYGARAAQLHQTAVASTDPALPSYLKLYGVTI